MKIRIRSFDYPMVILLLTLLVFGVVMVYNASVVNAQKDFGDKYFFLKNQAIYGVIGVVFFFIISRIDYHFWSRFSFVALIGSLVMLLAVFIPGLGVKVYGAQRWLNIGFTTLQPAEIIKVSLILYFATLFTKKHKLTNFVFILAVVLGIVLLQRDMGTTTIIACIALSMYFLAEAPLTHFLTMIPLSVIAGIFFIFSSDYRKERFLSFLNPEKDLLGSSYHINQILIALGSGGFFGLGLGQSRQKYGFIPEVSTDSIFAVIGEELGFVGGIFLIAIYVLLIARCFYIARNAPDRFGSLFVGGIGAWIAAQAFINLASMTALIPLTGVPLPLVSYGGSSLIVTLAAMGIIANVSRQSSS